MATGKTRLNEDQRDLVKLHGLAGETDQIPDEIAIVGTGPSQFALPRDNKWEVWGCNGACIDTDCDRVFVMDGVEALKKRYPNFLDYLATRWVPIYMPEVVPEVPCSISFRVGSNSWGQIFAKFGVPWVGGTIGYMIAFALYRGVKGIHFFGCDLYAKGFNDNEYAEQIPTMNLWIGIAIGMGVKCYFPAEMVLAMPLRYGKHKGVEGTVMSDGAFTDATGKKWVDYERVQKRLGPEFVVTEDRPVGTELGVGIEREYLGARPLELV